MIFQRTRGIRTLLAVGQASLVSLAFWLCFFALTRIVPGSEMFTGRYVWYWMAVLAGLGLELAVRRSDRAVAPLFESSVVRHFPLALRQLAFGLGCLLVLLVITKDQAISRGFLIAFAAVLYPTLVWTSSNLPPRLTRALFGGRRGADTLLVGPVRRVAGLKLWLERKQQLGVRVAGLIATEAEAPVDCGGVPCLGTLDAFQSVVDSGAIVQVILLELPAPELARRLIQDCEQRGIRLLIVNDFAEQIHRPILSQVDEGVNVLTLFEEPLENPFNRILKRAFDLGVAIPVIIFALPPLALLVAILQRLQSPGPLWHLQKRAGLQNRVFSIWKFRTMHVHTEALEKQAHRGDERIFPAARWLRRFSLDEMPQFLNVLRGEMSVVGPRPHLVEHNRKFAEALANYHVRAFIKPGITGLAQVRGFRGEARTVEDIAARLQSDLVYMENWSLLLDVTIVARTCWQMLRPPESAR